MKPYHGFLQNTLLPFLVAIISTAITPNAYGIASNLHEEFIQQRHHSKKLIQAILEQETFKQHELTTVWYFTESNQPLNDTLILFVTKMMPILIGLATLWLVWLLFKHRYRWQKKAQSPTLHIPKQVPTSIFGLDIKRETLPEDIAHQAQKLWLNNRNHDAVSLLYRGALSVIFYANKFELTKGATEKNCIHLVKQFESKERTQCFTELTELWLLTTYAKRLPTTATFNRVCENWIYAFSAAYYADSDRT